MSDTTHKSGNIGAGDDEYTPTGTDQVAENLAALDDDEAELRAASSAQAWKTTTSTRTTQPC